MGGKDLFSLQFQVIVHDSGEVKTGTQATRHFTPIVKRKERINAWILACLPLVFYILILFRAQPKEWPH